MKIIMFTCQSYRVNVRLLVVRMTTMTMTIMTSGQWKIWCSLSKNGHTLPEPPCRWVTFKSIEHFRYKINHKNSHVHSFLLLWLYYNTILTLCLHTFCYRVVYVLFLFFFISSFLVALTLLYWTSTNQFE